MADERSSVPKEPSWWWTPLRITAVYLLFGALWIVWTDWLVARLFPDLIMTTRAQTIKGLLYVLGTAVFMHGLLWHHLSRRQRAARALYESQQRLRAVIDNIPQAVFWKDRRSVYLGCNRTFALHAGLSSPDEVVGRTDFDLLWAWEQAELYRSSDRRVVETGIPELGFVTSEQKAGGRQAWVRASKVPLCDAQGRIVGVLGIYEDITERLAAEQAEREQRALAEALRETALVFSSTLDLDKVLEHVLETLERVVPYQAANVMLIEEGRARVVQSRGYERQDMQEITGDLRLPIAETPILREMAASGQPLLLEDTQRYSGWVDVPAMRWFRSYLGVPIRLSGEVIGFINLASGSPAFFKPHQVEHLQTFADHAATAIRNARLHAEARDRNRRLEILNRITRLGAATLDLEELLRTLANVAAEVIGGHSCYIALWDAARGLPIPAAASGERHDSYRQLQVRPGEVTLTESALREGKPLVVDHSSPMPYLSTSLRERLTQAGLLDQSTLVLPLRAGGQDIGALMLGFDKPHRFTPDEIAWAEQAAESVALAIARAQAYADLERRVAERTAELKAANTRLLELSEMKDRFVSSVSHELRTPIASIKLYHHLLAKHPEKQAAYMERLKRETDRLEAIIEELLYLSRLDQGRLAIHPTDMDLNRLAEEYVLDRTPLAEERGLRLAFERGDGLPLVRGDEAALGQAISVLLTNALNYKPRGGEVHVRTAPQEQDGRRWATLSVRDSGPGLLAEEIPHLFERFFRGKVGRETGVPGTGLGLPIAREIVERHGGRIEVGGPGPGACFTIWLPAVEAEGTESREHEPNNPTRV